MSSSIRQKLDQKKPDDNFRPTGNFATILHNQLRIYEAISDIAVFLDEHSCKGCSCEDIEKLFKKYQCNCKPPEPNPNPNPNPNPSPNGDSDFNLTPPLAPLGYQDMDQVQPGAIVPIKPYYVAPTPGPPGPIVPVNP